MAFPLSVVWSSFLGSMPSVSSVWESELLVQLEGALLGEVELPVVDGLQGGSSCSMGLWDLPVWGRLPLVRGSGVGNSCLGKFVLQSPQ